MAVVVVVVVGNRAGTVDSGKLGIPPFVTAAAAAAAAAAVGATAAAAFEQG